MKTLHTQSFTSSVKLAEKLFKLERQGRFSDALAVAKEFWSDIDASPTLDGFTDYAAAEMLLRLGAIIGFYGHNKQIPNAHIRSKDLLTAARQNFLELSDVKKIAECENYLALAYWRTGEFNEAELWVEESFSHFLPNASPIKLYTNLIKSLITMSIGNYEKNFNHLKPLEEDFNLYGDAFLNGNFYSNLGLSCNELGKYDLALHYFELARYYNERSRHKVYLGTVENNLAQLYKLEKRFQQAHLACDNATKIFKQIKDRTREGFSLDTKAQIYLHEAKFDDALRAIEKGLKILAKTENKGYLVETMMTKVKTLVYLDDVSAATKCLFEAVEIAKIHIDEQTANSLIQDFEKTLREKILAENARNIGESKTDSAFDDNGGEPQSELEFVLPPEIAHYDNIEVVRIQNSHFESVGLKQNSLAIVVKETLKRGDFAVLSEKGTDAVICGIYDAAYGIICLEGAGSEPLLFDENEVEILGKIVGVCETTPTNTDGKFFIQPLSL